MTELVTEEDLRWWLDLVPDLPWKFAETMPDIPHSYVVRGKTLDEESFVRAVRVIRTFGEPGKFYNTTRVYLTHGDRKWWTMGAPIEDTVIINTATTEKSYGKQDAPGTATGEWTIYDGLATSYDERYQNPADLAENAAVRSMIVQHFGAYAPTVLDVGGGTGLLLDMGITSPALYTVVDPSQGMLNELLRKHPRVSQVYPMRIEEALEVPDLAGTGQYELVASLFGSPSYVSPDAIKRLPDLCSDLLVLMHYREGYLPDYEQPMAEELTPVVDASREAARALGGQRSYLNQFEVTILR